MRRFSILVTAALLLFPCLPSVSIADELATDDKEVLRLKGEQIYKASCASCHGDTGEGVEGSYEDALVGDLSIGELTRQIADTMPEGEPELCRGEDAFAVATFIHHRFYSEAARLRNRPPRRRLARLTAGQLRQSLADLYASQAGTMWMTEDRGLPAVYFTGSRWKNENKKIERVDPQIHFNFGNAGPGEGIDAKDYYIHWKGGLLADVTGRYQIVVRCSSAFTLKFGSDRMLINNRVQSGRKSEFRETVFLTAGRVYPLTLELIQRKRKTEQPPVHIQLCWVPPHGIEEVIPERALVQASSPSVFSLQTILPPDDRSYGYERGIAVDRQWDESVTAAALEFAVAATEELWPRYQRAHRKDSNENRAQLRGFLAELVSTAFRQPLTDELRAVYVDKQVDAVEDDVEAIRRVLLLALKSPRFLYPLLDNDQAVSRRAANRLAMTLFDSLPSDRRLRDAAAKDQLQSEPQIRRMAEAMVNDFRTRAKMRECLYAWLNLSHLTSTGKDDERFPGFTEAIRSDLRDSLDQLLDDVVWGEHSDYRKFFALTEVWSTPRMASYYPGEFTLPVRTDDSVEPRASEDAACVPDEEEAETEEAEEPVVPEPVPWPGEFVEPVLFQKATASGDRRFGLLTHPLLMSELAYHDSTSPIHRGVFLIRYMLGRTLRPPNAAFTPLSPDLHPDMTTRERVELQTSPESCQVCHQRINGLGFSLENFDAVGRYRKTDHGKPVDSAGFYTTRDDQRVEFGGPAALAEFLAESEDAHRAFVSRVFQHFVKQPPAAFGPETLDRLTAQFRESGFHIRQLLVEIAVTATRPVLQQENQE